MTPTVPKSDFHRSEGTDGRTPSSSEDHPKVVSVVGGWGHIYIYFHIYIHAFGIDVLRLSERTFQYGGRQLRVAVP